MKRKRAVYVRCAVYAGEAGAVVERTIPRLARSVGRHCSQIFFISVIIVHFFIFFERSVYLLPAVLYTEYRLQSTCRSIVTPEGRARRNLLLIDRCFVIEIKIVFLIY